MVQTDWKRKATEYALDKKMLKKRIKELTKSRDEWKEKSIYHKATADKLAAALKKTKDGLMKLTGMQ